MNDIIVPKCENCMHFDLDGNHGDCRRYPPQVFVYDDDGSIDSNWCYPKVKSSDKCGEWRRF